ncbi:MAG: ExbD/TolR family protein [Planctomycetaceae bacterium]
MRIPTRAMGPGLKFNLTPMIDVVFNLIIFFLVASHFARSEALEPVDLPAAAGARTETAPALVRVAITLDRSGSLVVGGQSMELPELKRELTAAAAQTLPADIEVRLRVDRGVPWSQLEPVLVECAAAGLTRVRFAAIPETE